MDITVGLKRRTLVAVGLAALALALAAPLWFGGLSAPSGDEPSAPEGPFAGNFTFSDPPVPAPSVEFAALEGGKVTLADFKGQMVLVNFWATWCAPCVREMPDLERLHLTFADEGFQVLAVSEDRGGGDVVTPFLSRLDLQQLPIFLDPKGNFARAFDVPGLPTTFLVDRQGRVVASLVGPAAWDSPEAEDFIRHYLGPGFGNRKYFRLNKWNFTSILHGRLVSRGGNRQNIGTTGLERRAVLGPDPDSRARQTGWVRQVG